jgi:hypothetical protein
VSILKPKVGASANNSELHQERSPATVCVDLKPEVGARANNSELHQERYPVTVCVDLRAKLGIVQTTQNLIRLVGALYFLLGAAVHGG